MQFSQIFVIAFAATMAAPGIMAQNLNIPSTVCVIFSFIPKEFLF